jgi:uncharacterized phage-like protein YoqJ
MIFAATGHRPPKLGGYSAAVDDRLRALARVFLRGRKPRGAISGMALGWDMAWAEAALELGIPLCAAVPFDGQERQWPESSRARHAAILRAAAKIVVVSPGGYDPRKMQRRNEWMVDKAQLVVALWDGTAGGTGNCIAYAQRAGKPIENLWPRWRA